MWPNLNLWGKFSVKGCLKVKSPTWDFAEREVESLKHNLREYRIFATGLLLPGWSKALQTIVLSIRIFQIRNGLLGCKDFSKSCNNVVKSHVVPEMRLPSWALPWLILPWGAGYQFLASCLALGICSCSEVGRHFIAMLIELWKCLWFLWPAFGDVSLRHSSLPAQRIVFGLKVVGPLVEWLRWLLWWYWYYGFALLKVKMQGSDLCVVLVCAFTYILFSKIGC